MTETNIMVSLVIPTFNEKKLITKTIDEVLSYFANEDYKFEIIIVDDASSDRTPELVMAYAQRYDCIRLIINETNRGKGFSVKKGVLSAQGKYIVFTDADLSTPIKELSILLHSLSSGYDIVIGSRIIESSRVKVKQPWLRRIMGRFFNMYISFFFSINISDTQCGFKGFEAAAAKRLFSMQKISGFSFDVEILYLAKLVGYRVKEIPVLWINRTDSRVRILKDSLNMALDVLRIKLNSFKGLYRDEIKETRDDKIL